MLCKKEILSALEKFSFAKGKPVIVHTSLKAIGDVDGEVLLSALIEFFTQNDGLLIIPTHTWDSEVFDRRSSRTCLGVFPTLAASRKDAVRSLHPTHSVAVFGKNAKEIASLDDDVDTPASPDGVFGKILDMKGYVLLVGVGHDKNTFIHFVEEKLKVPGRLTREKVERTIIHTDGREEKKYLYWFDDEKIDDVSVFFPKFEKAFRCHGAITDGKLGNAKLQLCSAEKIFSTLSLIYQNYDGRELLCDHSSLDEKLYSV